MAEPELPSIFSLIGQAPSVRPDDEEDEDEIPSIFDIIAPGTTDRLKRGPGFQDVETGQSTAYDRTIPGGVPTAQVPKSGEFPPFVQGGGPVQVPTPDDSGVVMDTLRRAGRDVVDQGGAIPRRVSQAVNRGVGSIIEGGGKLVAENLRDSLSNLPAVGPLLAGPVDAGAGMLERFTEEAAIPFKEAGAGKFATEEQVARDTREAQKGTLERLATKPVETVAEAVAGMAPFLVEPAMAPSMMAAMGRQSGEEEALAAGANPEEAETAGRLTATVDTIVGHYLPERLLKPLKGEAAKVAKSATEIVKDTVKSALLAGGQTEAHQAVQRVMAGTPMNHKEAAASSIIFGLFHLTSEAAGRPSQKPPIKPQDATTPATAGQPQGTATVPLDAVRGLTTEVALPETERRSQPELREATDHVISQLREAPDAELADRLKQAEEDGDEPTIKAIERITYERTGGEEARQRRVEFAKSQRPVDERREGEFRAAVDKHLETVREMSDETLKTALVDAEDAGNEPLIKAIERVVYERSGQEQGRQRRLAFQEEVPRGQEAQEAEGRSGEVLGLGEEEAEAPAEGEPASSFFKKGVEIPEQTDETQGAPGQGFGAQRTIYGTRMSDVERSLSHADEAPKRDPHARYSGTQRVKEVLSKIWNVPIRTRMMRMKKAQGEYHTRPQVVRLQQPGDIVTMAHETGHHIYQNQKLATGDFPELRKMGDELYPGHPDQALMQNEGFAEFTRLAWSGFDTSKIAPEFTKEWNRRLENNPKLRRDWQRSRDAFDQWRGQTPMEKAKGQINFQRSVGSRLKGFLRKTKENVALFGRGEFREVRDRYEDKRIETEARRRKERDTFRFLATNRWDPIERVLDDALGRVGLTRDDLAPAKNAAMRAAAEIGTAAAKVRDAIDNGWSIAGKRITPSLKEAFDKIDASEYEDAMGYMLALRTLELAKRGKETGLSVESAAKIVAGHPNPKFVRAAKIFNDWANGLVDWAVHMEYIDRDSAQKIKDSSAFYIPLQRIFDAEVASRGGDTATGARGTFRRLSKKGDQRPIEDPTMAMASMAERIVSQAIQHRVASDTLNLVASIPGTGDLVERVRPPKEVRQATIGMVEKQLLAMGFDKDQIKANRDELLTLFFQPTRYGGPENIVALRNKKGKVDFFQLGDPLLSRAVTGESGTLGGLQGKATGGLVTFADKTLRRAKRAFTMGATGVNLGFTLGTGLVRDIGQVVVQGGPSTIAESFKAVGSKEWRKRYRESGGEMFSRISEDRAIFKDVRDSMLAHTSGQKAMLLAKHPVETFRKVLGEAESFMRRGAYKQAYERTLKEGGSVEDAEIAASHAGAESSVNFRRGGVEGMVINQYVGFFNPAIQGMTRTNRALKDPKVWARGFIMLTAPALRLWWKNKDEEWYKNRPLWEKATRIHINEDLMLPVPQELGLIFATGPIAALESIRQRDPEHFQRMLPILADVITPPNPLIPSAFRPAYDVARNKSGLGRPIVSKSMERKIPERQFDANTAESYKAIGKEFGISPVKVKYLFESYTGGAFRDSNTGLTFLTTHDPADLLVVKRFVPNKKVPGDYVTRISEQSEEAEKVYTSIRDYEKNEEWDEASKLEKKNAKLLGLDESAGDPRERYPRLFAIRDAREKMKDVREADPESYPDEATRLAREVLEADWKQ